MVTPSFVAEAKLYVKFGREYTYRAQAGNAELVAESFDRGQVIKSEIEILQAQDLADVVIERLGVGHLYPGLLQPTSTLAGTMHDLLDNLLARIGMAGPSTPGLTIPAQQRVAETARELFLSSLAVHGGAESNVITVSFAHPDRQVAAEALNALIDAYLAKRRPLFAEFRAPGLEPEMAAAYGRVEAIEGQLAAFRAATGIISFDSQRQILLEQQGALDRDLQGVESDRAAAERRASRLQAAAQALPAMSIIFTDSQSSASASLQAAASTPSVPAVSGSAGRRVLPPDDLRTVRHGPNPVFEALSAQLIAAESDRDAASARSITIVRQLADLGARLGALATHERDLTVLNCERDLATAAYQTLTEKLQEARVADEAALREAANVRVMQAPHVPASPQTARFLIVLLGLFAAACATMAVAFACDLLRHGFITPEQLELAVGLPVVAAVPFRYGPVAFLDRSRRTGSRDTQGI